MSNTEARIEHSINTTIFPEFKRLFNSRQSISNNISVLSEQFNHWFDRFKIEDWDKFISVKGREIALFHGAMKLEIKSKQVNVRLPHFRADLFNHQLNHEALANHLLKNFVLSENADKNTIALLMLGMMINAEKNGVGYADTLSQTQNAEFFYLMLTDDEDYKSITESLEFEHENALDALNEYREKFNPIFVEFKNRFRPALLDLFKIKEDEVDEIRNVFDALKINTKHIQVRVHSIEHNKVEIALAENYKELAGQINAIKQYAPPLLTMYAHALYDQIVVLDYDVYQFITNSKKAIESLVVWNVNYTKFYCGINSAHLSRLLNKAESFLPDVSVESLAKKVDVLQVLFGKLDTDNLNEGLSKSDFDSSSSFVNGLALFAMVLVAKDKDANEQKVGKIMDVFIKTFRDDHILNIILHKFFHANKADIKAKSAAYSGFVAKLLTLLLAEKEDNFEDLFKNPRYTVRDTYLVKGFLDKDDEILSLNTLIEASDSLNEFVARLRKSMSLAMIGKIVENGNLSNFTDRNILRPESIEVNGIVLESMNDWKTLFDFYQQNDFRDSFILSAHNDFFDKFDSYGAIYKAVVNGAVHLIFFNLSQSVLPNFSKKYTNFVFNVFEVSNGGFGDIEAEAYKLAFLANAELNFIQK